VLIIDEAQHLHTDLLEELRLLGNLEAATAKAVQTVLVAQPAILERLQVPELASLRQRLVTRCRLEPLGQDEAVDYLIHHLRAAGGRPRQIMSVEALELLAQETEGVPRLLSQAAHRALGLAQAADASQVDAEAALEALASLGLGEEITAVTIGEQDVHGDPAGEEAAYPESMAAQAGVFRAAGADEGYESEATDDPAPMGVIGPIAAAPRRPA
jgi:hypothetical protein